jgi:ribosomal protein S12 methylthiotransferase accessory factor YcaO
VPDVPFPRINDTAAVNELVSLYVAEGMRRGLLDIAKKAAPVVMALLAAVVWYMRR